MSETTLQINFVVKGDQAALQKVQKVLRRSEGEVASAVKRAIIEAGVADDFELKLTPVTQPSAGSGGLSSQEWMETEELSSRVSEEESPTPDFGKYAPHSD